MSRELEKISEILDKNPRILELVLQDLCDNSRPGEGASGLSAEFVMRAHPVSPSNNLPTFHDLLYYRPMVVPAGERSLNRTALRFVVVFFLLVLFFTFLARLAWVDERVIAPYVAWLAEVIAFFMAFLGITAEAQGTLIRNPAFVVDIRRGCDGVVATLILLSALAAYPARWRDRLWGFAAGFFLIFSLNLIRVVVLFWLGMHGSSLFDLVHNYVSQFIVIALAMVFWLFWAGKQRPVNV